MKLRVQNDRSDFRGAVTLRDSPAVMQPNSNDHTANGLSLTLQPELLSRVPIHGAAGGDESIELRLPMTGGPGESVGGGSSRRSRISPHTYTHSHSHSHSHGHPHGHRQTQRHSGSESEPSEPEDSDSEPEEAAPSLSELRHVFRWLQKSLPFLVILCAKLVVQHALGLAVGIGLFITFLYVNKNIQAQVFLQDRHSKLQCVGQLLFLISSSLLLYYTFHTETLYNCLIFLSPTIQPLGFWETMWAVGVTNFNIKFLYMGVKCLVLLLPSSLVSYKAQGRCLMLTEELAQVHQALAPLPLWFRYLVSYQESEGAPGLTLGVALALLYLIVKLLGLYGQWIPLLKTMKLFLVGEHTGTPATKSQCSDAGDFCPICHGEYREPRALLCQHIFCDACIALWFNRDKSCPLCRAVIKEKVYMWRDGSTSLHLQIY